MFSEFIHLFISVQQKLLPNDKQMNGEFRRDLNNCYDLFTYKFYV